jgi:2-polyprenyl-6-methoxyphenol hydroxylase-like FAD-dependent oxidoreductase
VPSPPRRSERDLNGYPRRVKSLRVAVLGAGPAGLSMALAVARAGHRVALVDRDPVEVTSADDAFLWPRKGVAHFLQPHAFNPRGRREMRIHLPDVYAAVLDAGAEELDLRRRLSGPARPGDEDLVYLGVRRPMIEWALRKALLAQPEIELLPHTRLVGLLGDSARVAGARTEQGEIRADLVVDALGRTSPAPAWLAEIGASPPAVETSDCDVLYYTRYYRVRDGETLPDGPWLPTPRGILPYCLFSSFPGDNRTFGALLAILPQDHELKMLRREDAFDATVAAMPSLLSWTSRSEPITGVLAMGSLQNSFRRYRSSGRRGVPGFIPVGDALCHTNPMFALGLSQSLIHAFALATALTDASRLDDVPEAYHSAVEPEAVERFALATECDQARGRWWRGEPVDFVHRSGARQLFLLAAGGATALADPDIFRAHIRRLGFLDRTGVLDDDVALQQRMEDRFAELRASRPLPLGPPTRDELLARLPPAS